MVTGTSVLPPLLAAVAAGWPLPAAAAATSLDGAAAAAAAVAVKAREEPPEPDGSRELAAFLARYAAASCATRRAAPRATSGSSGCAPSSRSACVTRAAGSSSLKRKFPVPSRQMRRPQRGRSRLPAAPPAAAAGAPSATRRSPSASSSSEGRRRPSSSWKPRPKRDFRRCADPRHRSRPPTMMPIRVHSASHSSMECVVRMMAACWRSVEIRVITSHMNRRATGSMPVEGSSRKMSSGPPIMATATLSLRLFPPEYPPESLSAYSVSWSWWIPLATSPSNLEGGMPLIMP
mmetsp:Transcript_11363/g.20293  ORF Transcript_11363/g.20293 Transcript_11363/m.20293 type:complete len:291 (-) Transcript_11363:63-935(-)